MIRFEKIRTKDISKIPNVKRRYTSPYICNKMLPLTIMLGYQLKHVRRSCLDVKLTEMELGLLLLIANGINRIHRVTNYYYFTKKLIGQRLYFLMVKGCIIKHDDKTYHITELGRQQLSIINIHINLLLEGLYNEGVLERLE